MPALPLPAPVPDSGAKFELLVLTKLDQMAVRLAEIHQLVSPPEKQDGPSLVEVILQLTESVTAQSEQLAHLTTAVERSLASRSAG
jgi:hypothetical protein